MHKDESNLMKPDIETLLSKVNTKFTLVSLAAKRSREINDYYNQLGEGLGKIVPPQITSTSRKSLSIALEEIALDKIAYVELEEEPETPKAEEPKLAEESKTEDSTDKETPVKEVKAAPAKKSSKKEEIIAELEASGE